ncbi:hypothetical protein FXF51_30450 [Nonomuraea sp. PA05]|uniref:hypothetical protein n=1 Tax=Nonomuraea sp. PA05 TaxID=2604466 RepID=UPI0011D3BA9A|nr:hypothetical protein [Nonomuraea sp. PA05]TYB60547.1 hypothetical protein FXF51_30450 [Nonomuraea sp. PA05]
MEVSDWIALAGSFVASVAVGVAVWQTRAAWAQARSAKESATAARQAAELAERQARAAEEQVRLQRQQMTESRHERAEAARQERLALARRVVVVAEETHTEFHNLFARADLNVGMSAETLAAALEAAKPRILAMINLTSEALETVDNEATRSAILAFLDQWNRFRDKGLGAFTSAAGPFWFGRAVRFRSDQMKVAQAELDQLNAPIRALRRAISEWAIEEPEGPDRG